MAIPRFWERIYASVGSRLSVTKPELEEVFGQHLIRVHVGPGCAVGNDAWTADLLVNMFARLYPRLQLVGEAATCALLESRARSINPGITLEQTTAIPTLIVACGCSSAVGETAIYTGADGWVASVMDEPLPTPRGPANPYAAAAAAALGAAEVFRRVMRARIPEWEEPEPTRVSLLDFTETGGATFDLPKCNLGEVALVGLGAVGQGALWAMGRHSTLEGHIWLIDHEDIELSNLQRYVLTTDADERVEKVLLAERALVGTQLKPERIKAKLEEFAERFGQGFSIPTVGISVDNADGRRAAQALLPRLVVNGWASESAFGASSHVFSEEAACLACLYHPRGEVKSQTQLVAQALGLSEQRAADLWVTGSPPTDGELRQIASHLGLQRSALDTWRGKPLQSLYSGVICGAVQLDLKGTGRVATVPLAHQSVLAGALLAAELLKRTNPDLDACSQAARVLQLDDILKPPTRRWASRVGRSDRCICTDEMYQRTYKAKWEPAPHSST